MCVRFTVQSETGMCTGHCANETVVCVRCTVQIETAFFVRYSVQSETILCVSALCSMFWVHSAE